MLPIPITRLVITRKTDESFTIDGDIAITLGKIRGKQVRLIIDAPENILIQRDNAKKDVNKNNKNITRAQAIKWGFL